MNKMNFKKVVNSEVIENVPEYIKNFIRNNPGAKIIVGSDSLEFKGATVFATIIAMFYPSWNGESYEFHKGAHLLYHRKTVRKHHVDLWSRLWQEVEMSMETADFIEKEVFDNEGFKKSVEIHLDINPDEKWESNKVLSAAVGMLKSLGYIIEVKPNSWVASCAADMIVR